MQYVDFSNTQSLAERERMAYVQGDTATAAMLAQLQDHAETAQDREEFDSETWTLADSAVKAADTLAEILDYAAEGTGYHRGTDYFESLRASKKQDREDTLQEFIEDIRTQLGDIYAALNRIKDR